MALMDMTHYGTLDSTQIKNFDRLSQLDAPMSALVEKIGMRMMYCQPKIEKSLDSDKIENVK